MKVYKDLIVNQFTWEIIKFLESDINRIHLRYKEGVFYVRKTQRNLYTSCAYNKSPYSVFDIGSVDIKPKYRNKGYFKSFLLTLAYCNPYDYVYVECVHNDILKNYLMKNGWLTSDEESFHIETELLKIHF